MSELTPRQVKILEAIKSAVDKNGYPPSLREIGAAAGLTSPASVQYQLKALEEKGFIRRDADSARAIEVFMPGMSPDSEFQVPSDKTKQVPLVGRIAAGSPILAEQ